tara:strand:- start:405 stop:653 length:249 start_codon:yes stop_codon:yes gene_type:complete
MTWFVYILRCSDDSLYTGITNNLERRITQHNNGTGAKYTRNRAPVQLIYQEDCDDRASASQREYAIKQLSRIQKIELISASA